jgi:uracil permease
MERQIIGLHENPSLTESLPLVFQYHTDMFGAPSSFRSFFGENLAKVIVMNGIGTILSFGVA